MPPFLAAMGAWVMAGLGWLRQRSRAAPVGPAGEAWLAPCIVIVCMAVSNGAHAGASMISLAFNLVFLALSVSWMARGCREGAPAPAAVGSVMLAMLVFARYFDLFVSLAARGFMFLVVGGVLFSEGIMYMRARRRMKKQEVQQ